MGVIEFHFIILLLQVDDESDFSFSDRKRGYNQHIDLKQARFEVRKLGIKGFKGEQKEEAMTSLLLRLGAKVRIHLALYREKFFFVFFFIFFHRIISYWFLLESWPRQL